MIVDVLHAVHDVEPVESALRPWAVEPRPDVVARERARRATTLCETIRESARLVPGDRGDVPAAGAFRLDLHVRDLGVRRPR